MVNMTTRLTAHYIEINARAVNPDAAPADKIRLFLDDSGIVSYIDEAGNVTELAGNAVRYDMPQGLDPGQRSQARQNILAEQLGAAAVGARAVDIAWMVFYRPQAVTRRATAIPTRG
jgi:hypothetical protein